MKSPWIITSLKNHLQNQGVILWVTFPNNSGKWRVQEFATKHVNILVARIDGKGDKKVEHPIMQNLAQQVIQPRIFRQKSCEFTLPSTDRTKVKRVIPKNSFRRQKNRWIHHPSTFAPHHVTFFPMASTWHASRGFFGWLSVEFQCTSPVFAPAKNRQHLNEEPFQGHMAFHEIPSGWWWDKLIMAY